MFKNYNNTLCDTKGNNKINVIINTRSLAFPSGVSEFRIYLIIVLCRWQFSRKLNKQWPVTINLVLFELGFVVSSRKRQEYMYSVYIVSQITPWFNIKGLLVTLGLEKYVNKRKTQTIIRFRANSNSSSVNINKFVIGNAIGTIK